MPKTRNIIVAQARSWLGCKESDGSHRKIIDLYNNHKPLARGYKVKYTDAWCATFGSSVAIAVGYTDIIPTECGCEEQINLFKKIGSWVENDAYVPLPGDYIFYDWNDSGKGDNVGIADHVGIVETCDGQNIIVIEGNKNDAVEKRVLVVNGRYIRGFGVPKYDEMPEKNLLTSANDIAWELNHSYFPILEMENFVDALNSAKMMNSPLYWGYYKLVNHIK